MFKVYALVGVANTVVHYLMYFLFITAGLSQSKSNLIAFTLAVTCSYFLNVKFTFKTKYRPMQYSIYIFFMAFISYSIGSIGDHLGLPSIISLLSFSMLSLFIGYKFSKLLFLKEL